MSSNDSNSEEMTQLALYGINLYKDDVICAGEVFNKLLDYVFPNNIDEVMESCPKDLLSKFNSIHIRDKPPGYNEIDRRIAFKNIKHWIETSFEPSAPSIGGGSPIA